MNTITETHNLTKTALSPLKSISEIRDFFRQNDTPVYFFGPTGFNLLGAEDLIKGFKFINHIDCFDGLNSNIFCPKEEMSHEGFQSIEDINNYLLKHKEVKAFIHQNENGGEAGKALFLMFDENTEQLTKEAGLESGLPSAKLRNFLDNKVNTNRIAEKAGVPCVPYVLSPVFEYKHLRFVSEKLGEHLVIQTPYGDSGRTTFFISNETDYNKYAAEIEQEKEVKIMKRINCRGSAIEGCVTRHGTVVGPLMTELVGFKELTPYKGGWCGNEISSDAFSLKIREKAAKYTRLFGDQLKKEGYTGYFELDFLIDEDDQNIYLGELNPRITGASALSNHATFEMAGAPLYLFHILDHMNRDYELNVAEINRRLANTENANDWSQLIIKYTENSVELVTEAPRSGIWTMPENGNMVFDRPETHFCRIESNEEAFFLRITRKRDYIYKDTHLGILFMRGRMMTRDGELNERAKNWIKAVRASFKSSTVTSPPPIVGGLSGKGGCFIK